MIRSFRVVLSNDSDTILNMILDRSNRNFSYIFPLMDSRTTYIATVYANSQCGNVNPSANTTATVSNGKNNGYDILLTLKCLLGIGTYRLCTSYCAYQTGFMICLSNCSYSTEYLLNAALILITIMFLFLLENVNKQKTDKGKVHMLKMVGWRLLPVCLISYGCRKLTPC